MCVGCERPVSGLKSDLKETFEVQCKSLSCMKSDVSSVNHALPPGQSCLAEFPLEFWNTNKSVGCGGDVTYKGNTVFISCIPSPMPIREKCLASESIGQCEESKNEYWSIPSEPLLSPEKF